MTLKALLRSLLYRLAVKLRAVCHWDPRTRLRFCLSILWKWFPKQHRATDDAAGDVFTPQNHVEEVCCSMTPPSAAASQTSLHVPGIILDNLNPPSRASSRAASIRSARTYQSAYDDEERRSRAKAITAEQSQEIAVERPWTRVAVSSSRSRSRSRAPSKARPSRSNSPTRTHSEHSLSRTSTRGDCRTRPATPLNQVAHPDPQVSTGTGYGVERPVTPPATVSPTFTRASPPTLEITTIDVEPPSPTSPSSSRQHGTPMDPNLLRPDSRQSHESSAGTSAATSPTAFNDNPGVLPELPEAPSHRIWSCITPEDLPRYNRRATTVKKARYHELQPLTRAFPHEVPKPKIQAESIGGWKAFTHAEGSLYFLHPSKRIWTNAYMYEQLYYQEVEDFVAFLEDVQQSLMDSGIPFPVDYELVIEITKTEENEEELLWQYYYVDHANRSIFWLHRRILWKELDTVKGCFSPDHIHLKIQQLYWHHVFHFPEGRPHLSTHFDKDVWSRLLCFMEFNALDTIVSPRSTSFYSHLELIHMKNMVKLAYDQSKEHALLPDLLSAVARIQMLMAEQRFLHAHGQPYVRLKNNDSIHPDSDGCRSKSWLFYVIGFTLFRAPFTLLEDLHNVTVDGIVQEFAWRRYFKRLLEDWDKLVLQGTVILTANVSFLAIPDVIHFPGQPSGTGGASGIQPWVRPLFNWSLLLARLNRSQIEHSTDADDACRYLERHTSVIFDLEPMAIIYSLPYALLLWGVGFFLAALLSFTFDSTDKATRVVVGAGAVLVTGLLLWSILSGKLMILNRIWPWIQQTDAYEWFEESILSVARTATNFRSVAITNLLTFLRRLKRATKGKRAVKDSHEQVQAGSDATRVGRSTV
ncbi:unnamed protein product [Peniophora sp. CBMAI 1063]|nr:unnamed protein product [Peniophora sp. CBMAI 1063]